MCVPKIEHFSAKLGPLLNTLYEYKTQTTSLPSKTRPKYNPKIPKRDTDHLLSKARPTVHKSATDHISTTLTTDNRFSSYRLLYFY